MAKLTKFVPKERPEIQDNIYTARIVKVEQKVWSEDNISLSWVFELAQPPYLNQKIWVYGSTGTTPTPKARLTAWGAALGHSREQMADSSFDTEAFVGSYVKVFLKTWTKENGGEKQGVTDLIPLTEADQQLLQMWLSQAQVTGPQKVAVQASAPVVHTTPVAVPSVAVVQAPAQVTPMTTGVPVAPVVTAPAPVAPKRTSSFPF